MYYLCFSTKQPVGTQGAFVGQLGGGEGGRLHTLDETGQFGLEIGSDVSKVEHFGAAEFDVRTIVGVAGPLQKIEGRDDVFTGTVGRGLLLLQTNQTVEKGLQEIGF